MEGTLCKGTEGLRRGKGEAERKEGQKLTVRGNKVGGMEDIGKEM